MPSEAPGARPRLEVVGDRAGGPADSRSSERTRRGPWILLALLLLVGVALGVQSWRVGVLEREIQGLGAELDAARGEVAAYERQLGRVRGLVDDLGARVQELRELVGRAPAGEPAEPGGPEKPEESL